jgi:hypothetical protein
LASTDIKILENAVKAQDAFEAPLPEPAELIIPANATINEKLEVLKIELAKTEKEIERIFTRKTWLIDQVTDMVESQKELAKKNTSLSSNGTANLILALPGKASFGQSTKGANESLSFISDNRPLDKNAQRRLDYLLEKNAIFQNMACHNLKGIDLDDILVENSLQPNLPKGQAFLMRNTNALAGDRPPGSSKKKQSILEGMSTGNPYQDDVTFGRMPCYLHKIALTVSEHTVK